MILSKSLLWPSLVQLSSLYGCRYLDLFDRRSAAPRHVCFPLLFSHSLISHLPFPVSLFHHLFPSFPSSLSTSLRLSATSPSLLSSLPSFPFRPSPPSSSSSDRISVFFVQCSVCSVFNVQCAVITPRFSLYRRHLARILPRRRRHESSSDPLRSPCAATFEYR